jgi:hypothetical protein
VSAVRGDVQRGARFVRDASVRRQTAGECGGIDDGECGGIDDGDAGEETTRSMALTGRGEAGVMVRATRPER